MKEKELSSIFFSSVVFHHANDEHTQDDAHRIISKPVWILLCECLYLEKSAINHISHVEKLFTKFKHIRVLNP